jgi:hypothetical protein
MERIKVGEIGSFVLTVDVFMRREPEKRKTPAMAEWS